MGAGEKMPGAKMEVRDVEATVVLSFWFKELTREQWFKVDPEVDSVIRNRFINIYRQAASESLSDWHLSPEGRLAEILVLDQFPRNMFRGKPEAFATDALALRRAQEAVRTGAGQKLTTTQKAFLYMPYMHSESREVHEEAVKLFRQPGLEFNLKYELAHKEIIDRFGRYPHRNAILGRKSTPEETEFLKVHKGF